MVKGVMMIGLVLISVVAILGSEAAAYKIVGGSICWACSFGCQMTGVGYKGGAVADGRVANVCDAESGGGQVLQGEVECVNPQGRSAGGAGLSFLFGEAVNEADVTRAGKATTRFFLPSSTAEVQALYDASTPPEACDTNGDFIGDIPADQCLARLWGIETEYLAGQVCNNNWILDRITISDACVRFLITEDDIEVASLLLRCTDVGSGGFIPCFADNQACPAPPAP